MSDCDCEHSLSTTEFGFVQMLVNANAEAVSQPLFGREWSLNDSAEDNLGSKLRQKVEPIPGPLRYIMTVRHKGYMISDGVFDIVG